MSDVVYLGDDIDFTFRVVDAAGLPVNITGVTLSCECQRPYSDDVAIVAAATFIDSAVGGQWRARFTAAQTALFTPGAVYRFDGRITIGGLRHTVGQGAFRAASPVTP